MNQHLTIFIPGIPRNANARGEAKYNRWDKAKFRRRSEQVTREEMGDWQPQAKTLIKARHVHPMKRKRDPLGLAERLKGIVDGLVDAGLIEDDDEDHIEIILGPWLKDERKGIQLEITTHRTADGWCQVESHG